MASPRIAIVGAGPAGLTLARILYINGISATVFDLDAHANDRPQGGTLDLHEESGQAALHAAGLFDKFASVARYDGEDLIVKDRFNTTHVEMLEEHGQPEVDRSVLRQLLLDSLPASTVRWGKKLAKAEVGTLHFADGTSETGFDLVIGADGAWSKVRPLVTTVQPFYSGVSGVDIDIRDVDKRYPELSAMTGRGSHFAWGDEIQQSILSQRTGDGSIRAYAFSREPESWVKTNTFDWDDLAQTKEDVCAWLPAWAPELLAYVRAADSLAPRPLYMLPPGLRWQHRAGVTLIGDAAHLMTPFAGEGVNAAMTDAMKLAQAITQKPQDVNAAVKEYEQWLFPAAEKVTSETWRNLNMVFMEGGIAKFKAMISGQRPGDDEK